MPVFATDMCSVVEAHLWERGMETHRHNVSVPEWVELKVPRADNRKERGGRSQTAPRRMQPRGLREKAEIRMGRAYPPQARKLPSQKDADEAAKALRRRVSPDGRTPT